MPDVVVIGGANLDIKAKTEVANRLGTSNPGTILTSPGGVARNIAHNLARQGADTALIAVVGDDPTGTAVLDATKAAGVDVSRVVRERVSTGTYVAVMQGNGELLTAISDMRAVDLITPETIGLNSDIINQAKIIVADCNLAVASLQALADLCAHKLLIEPVSVSKSAKLMEVLKSHKLFMASPNIDQLESLTGTREVTTAAKKLHASGIMKLVIHAGSDGAYVSDGKNIDHLPAQTAGQIVDVTGAGDAAVAGLVFGLLRGETLSFAAARGQALAGRVLASKRSTVE